MENFIKTKTFAHNGKSYDAKYVIFPLGDKFIVFTPYRNHITNVSAEMRKYFPFDYSLVIFNKYVTNQSIVYSDTINNMDIYCDVHKNHKKNFLELFAHVNNGTHSVMTHLLINIVFKLAYNESTRDFHKDFNSIYLLDESTCEYCFGRNTLDMLGQMAYCEDICRSELAHTLWFLTQVENFYAEIDEEDAISFHANAKFSNAMMQIMNTNKERINAFIKKSENISEINTMFLGHNLVPITYQKNKISNDSRTLFNVDKNLNMSHEGRIFLIIIEISLKRARSQKFHYGRAIENVAYGFSELIVRELDDEISIPKNKDSSNVNHNHIAGHVLSGTFNMSGNSTLLPHNAPSITNNTYFNSVRGNNSDELTGIVAELKKIFSEFYPELSYTAFSNAPDSLFRPIYEIIKMPIPSIKKVISA